jgi:hypothetical protein
MSDYPNLGPGPVRGLAPLFRRRSLWALVRLVARLVGAACVFGLLMLASLWFAIPFALALTAAGVVCFVLARRARIGWLLVRRLP